ncbi:hypothetical protein HaLaN_18414 [Haematococcus lacustris]|uniref:Uncharacterized protein n=1 Tax=Haematococcus lacustris TaxID=44745 RepID=A0A699ZRY2_HAELA|nr:hypothetical protein HaLaN_18414 [Haematococcus lacustris]
MSATSHLSLASLASHSFSSLPLAPFARPGRMPSIAGGVFGPACCWLLLAASSTWLWLGYGVVPSVGSFQPALTAIDPISMTPSILRQSTGFDDPGENVRRACCQPPSKDDSPNIVTQI